MGKHEKIELVPLKGQEGVPKTGWHSVSCRWEPGECIWCRVPVNKRGNRHPRYYYGGYAQARKDNQPWRGQQYRINKASPDFMHTVEHDDFFMPVIVCHGCAVVMADPNTVREQKLRAQIEHVKTTWMDLDYWGWSKKGNDMRETDVGWVTVYEVDTDDVQWDTPIADRDPSGWGWFFYGKRKGSFETGEFVSEEKEVKMSCPIEELLPTAEEAMIEALENIEDLF